MDHAGNVRFGGQEDPVATGGEAEHQGTQEAVKENQFVVAGGQEGESEEDG